MNAIFDPNRSLTEALASRRVSRSSPQELISQSDIIAAAQAEVKKSIAVIKKSLHDNLRSQKAWELMERAEQEGVLHQYLTGLVRSAERAADFALKEKVKQPREGGSSLMNILVGHIIAAPIVESIFPGRDHNQVITRHGFEEGVDRIDEAAAEMEKKALSKLGLDNEALTRMVKSYGVMVMHRANKDVGVNDPGFYLDYLTVRSNKAGSDGLERELISKLNFFLQHETVHNTFVKEADLLCKDFNIIPYSSKPSISGLK